MRKEDYRVYATSEDEAEILEMQSVLKRMGVRANVRSEEKTDTGENYRIKSTYILEVHKYERTRAKELLAEMTDIEADAINESHYLIEFTNDELRDVAAKEDEWSKYDYAFALKLLEIRGRSITPGQLHIMKAERYIELAWAEKESRWVIWAGYAGIFAMGIPTIIVGGYLKAQMKVLPDGRMIKKFRQKDRVEGQRMIIIGICVAIIWILAMIIRKSEL